MAIYGRALRQAAAARNEHARLARSLKRDFGEYVVVPFEWQTKNTGKACLFPTYGWVATSLIRCRKADGKVYGWDQFHEGDEFMLPSFVLERIGRLCPECGGGETEVGEGRP
jgi:hypothetical protein